MMNKKDNNKSEYSLSSKIFLYIMSIFLFIQFYFFIKVEQTIEGVFYFGSIALWLYIFYTDSPKQLQTLRDKDFFRGNLIIHILVTCYIYLIVTQQISSMLTFTIDVFATVVLWFMFNYHLSEAKKTLIDKLEEENA